MYETLMRAEIAAREAMCSLQRLWDQLVYGKNVSGNLGATLNLYLSRYGKIHGLAFDFLPRP